MQDQYAVMSQLAWDNSVKTGKLSVAILSLYSLENAGLEATGKAGATQQPHLVVKMQPVSFHRATVNVTVEDA